MGKFIHMIPGHCPYCPCKPDLGYIASLWGLYMLAHLQPHLIISASFIRGTKAPLGCLDVW